MWARDNILNVVEASADFLFQRCHSPRVAKQVENGGRQTSGRSIAASNHQYITLAPKFLRCKSLAGLGILGIEEIIEKVLFGLVARLGSLLGSLISLNTRFLNEIPPVISELA